MLRPGCKSNASQQLTANMSQLEQPWPRCSLMLTDEEDSSADGSEDDDRSSDDDALEWLARHDFQIPTQPADDAQSNADLDALLDADALKWLAQQGSHLPSRPSDDAQSYADFDAHWEALCRGDWELPQPTPPPDARTVEDAIVGPSTSAMFFLRARWPDGQPIDINILLLGFSHVSTGPFYDGVPVINLLQAAAGRAPRFRDCCTPRWKGKVSMPVEVLVQYSALPGFPTLLGDRTPTLLGREVVDAPPPRDALEQLAERLASSKLGTLGAGAWVRAFDTRVLSRPAINYPALERAQQLWDAHARDLVPNRSELYELFMGRLDRPGAAAAAEYVRDELFAGEAEPFATWYAWHTHISAKVADAETQLGPGARAELLAAIVIHTRPARPWIKWVHLSGIATNYYALLQMLGPPRYKKAWTTPKALNPRLPAPRACVVCAGTPETEHMWRVLHALMGAEPTASLPRTRTGRVELREMLVGPHQARPPTDLDELLTRMRLPRTRHTFNN